MGQLSAILLMLLFTLGFAGVLILPSLIRIKSTLLNFYWKWFWYALAGIVLVTGGPLILQMAGVSIDSWAQPLQFSTIMMFVLYVVFAWCHLFSAAFLGGLRWFRKVPHQDV